MFSIRTMLLHLVLIYLIFTGLESYSMNETYDYEQYDSQINSTEKFLDPEQHMGTIEILKLYGYPAKSHKLQTEDGYILELHQIVGSNTTENNVPILVMHGFACASDIWVDNLPQNSLGFLLNDKGYDVWLGNTRGNSYSRNHTSLKPNSEEFWNFSFDDYALKDVPAMIDFIIDTTGHKKILYIGHSLGTTDIMALLSAKPTYNEKILGIVALSPVIMMEHIKSPIIKAFAPFADTIKFSMEMMGLYEMFGKVMTKSMVDSFCTEKKYKLCMKLIFDAVGKDEEQFNTSRLHVYTRHVPSSTSLKTVYHLTQMYKSKRFCAYDYGSANSNKEAYESETPPDYDVRKVTAPVAIFWGENDFLLDPLDVQWLVERLPNVYLNYKIPYKRFNHVDFLWAMNVKEVLYYKVLDTVQNMMSL